MKNKESNPGTLATIAEYLPYVSVVVATLKSVWVSLFGPKKTPAEKKLAEWNSAVKDYRKNRNDMTWEKLQRLARILYPDGSALPQLTELDKNKNNA
jgi:hypothetical protein